VKSPVRWPGGKARLAETILSYMPVHDLYVEGCCGGAAMFWAKPREASRVEVLNDADGDLVNFYKVLHRAGRRLARQVGGLPYSRALFARMLAWRPAGDVAAQLQRLPGRPRAVRTVPDGAARCAIHDRL